LDEDLKIQLFLKNLVRYSKFGSKLIDLSNHCLSLNFFV
jgi:hypothetical protein